MENYNPGYPLCNFLPYKTSWRQKLLMLVFAANCETVKRSLHFYSYWFHAKMAWLASCMQDSRLLYYLIREIKNNNTVCSFPVLCFDIIRMPWCHGQNTRKLCFVYRSQKKCMWIAIIFVTDCFISVEWTFDEVLQHSGGGGGGGESTRKGVICWVFTPVYFS